MYIMTRVPDNENPYDNTTVTVETREVSTVELIKLFGDFLVACGHHPDNIHFDE